MKDRIACITKQRAAEILDSISEGNREYTPKGLFLHREGGHYIGIDNSNGEAWTEQFTTLGDCIDWLRGNADMDDIWAREAERAKGKIFCPSCHQGSSFTQWNNAEGNDIELDLKHELENDDEDTELWIHCPYCGAQVVLHMIIEENQDRIGWMSWKQEPGTVEEDIVAELDYPSKFQVMLEKRHRELQWFSDTVASLPENSWLEQILDGLGTYIRDGIDQDEPYNIVQTIKHQQEALHSLRAEKDSFAGSAARLAEEVKELRRVLCCTKQQTQQPGEVAALQSYVRDLQKNISKRDQEIANLTNLRATDKIQVANLMDEIGTLSCINSDLGEGIRKAEAEAKEARKSLTVIENYIQSLKDGYGKGKQ